MLKRLMLVGDGSRRRSGSWHWSAAIAQATGAAVTVAPLAESPSLTRVAPSHITTTHACRMLDDPPPDTEEERKETMRQLCREHFDEAQIAWELRDPAENAWQRTLLDSRFQDLAVLGYRDCFDPAVVPNTSDAAQGLAAESACPVLVVPDEVRPVRKIVFAFSGTVSSSRAMKRMLQLGLWPEAAVDIALLSSDGETGRADVSAARRYLEAHGVVATETLLTGDSELLVEYLRASKADLVVAGRNGVNWLGMESRSSVLDGLLAQGDVPALIAS